MSGLRITTVWLRGMRRLLYALVGIAVALGLGLTWRYWFRWFVGSLPSMKRAVQHS